MSNSRYSIRNEADKYQKGLYDCPFCNKNNIKISLEFWTKYNKDTNRAKVQCYCTKCYARGPRKVILLDKSWEPLDGYDKVFDEVRSSWGVDNDSFM